MFKKNCKVSNSHALSNKDKKQLKAYLSSKQNFSLASISLLFDDKEHELHIEKLVGQRTVVYSRNEIPLLFNPEGTKANTTLFPSCYFMF